MFGLPQQTIQQAIEDVTIASEFNVPHISHYQLTIEANTYFFKHTPVLPDSDLIWEMQMQCQNVLASHQYDQYEISAYSKKNRECAHNLNYWHFGDYIGIGAGAHGKLTDANDSAKFKVLRRWKHRQPQKYIEETICCKAVSGKQELEQADIVFEFLLNALRLKTGSDIETFTNNTGLGFDVLNKAVRDIDDSLLFIDKNKVRTTDQGFLFLNTILEELLEE